MTHEHRHATGPPPYSPLTYLSFGLVAAALVAVEIAVHAGAALDGWRRQPTWNPLVLLIDLRATVSAGPRRAPPFWQQRSPCWPRSPG